MNHDRKPLLDGRVASSRRRRSAGLADGAGPSRERGLTLIELIVTMVVAAVIASIAYPAYQDYIRKSRRAAAQGALMELATLQEQFFLDNKTYTVTIDAGGLNAETVTDDGTYDLSVDAPDASCPVATCFVLRATPGGAQAADSCGAMTLSSGGDRTPATDCWD